MDNHTTLKKNNELYKHVIKPKDKLKKLIKHELHRKIQEQNNSATNSE